MPCFWTPQRYLFGHCGNQDNGAGGHLSCCTTSKARQFIGEEHSISPHVASPWKLHSSLLNWAGIKSLAGSDQRSIKSIMNHLDLFIKHLKLVTMQNNGEKFSVHAGSRSIFWKRKKEKEKDQPMWFLSCGNRCQKKKGKETKGKCPNSFRNSQPSQVLTFLRETIFLSVPIRWFPINPPQTDSSALAEALCVQKSLQRDGWVPRERSFEIILGCCL